MASRIRPQLRVGRALGWAGVWEQEWEEATLGWAAAQLEPAEEAGWVEVKRAGPAGAEEAETRAKVRLAEEGSAAAEAAGEAAEAAAARGAAAAAVTDEAAGAAWGTAAGATAAGAAGAARRAS